MIDLKIESKIIILLLIILAIASAPVYAQDSISINNSTYGVDHTKTTPQVNISSQRTYYITPYTKPCSSKILRYTTYNKYTKNYYTMLSYMQKFEKYGGGTLILKKGTYYISNSVAIPSNVNLIFEDGVVINKGTITGTSKFKAAKSMFQLVQPSKLKTKNAYYKYNGVKNVKIIGKGNVVINMRYINKSTAIVCGHGQNIQIQGITFRNMYTGHFIEVDAINGMKISNCKFMSSKRSAVLNGEAINLDIPDRNTQGFNNIWSASDKTHNNNITIENNVFYGLDRAIGSHKYSQYSTNGRYVTGKGQIYHTWVTIKNNIIINMRGDPIHVLNWKNARIMNNYIANVEKNSNHYRGILAGGAIDLTIKNNYFVNMYRPLEVLVTKNNGVGYMYSITYNYLTRENYVDIANNYCSNVIESYARISFGYHYYVNMKKITLLT
jgi:hypothetical protein